MEQLEMNLKADLWGMIQHKLSIASKEERIAAQVQRFETNQKRIAKYGSLAAYRAARKHYLKQGDRGLHVKGGKRLKVVL